MLVTDVATIFSLMSNKFYYNILYIKYIKYFSIQNIILYALQIRFIIN